METHRSSLSVALFVAATYALGCSSTGDSRDGSTGGTPTSLSGGAAAIAGSVASMSGGYPGAAGTAPTGVGGTSNAAAGNGASTAGASGASVAGTGQGGASSGAGGAATGAAGAAGSANGGGGAGPTPVVTEVWVDPNGNDSNPGTLEQPMKTVCDTSTKTGACYRICRGSYTCPAGGGTIWMKDGVYAITKKIDLGATRPGSPSGIMKLYAVSGAKPVIDAAALDTAEVTKTGIGIHLKASYWHIRGLEVKNAPHNCIKVEGGYDTIENVVVHHCGNTGITIGQYSGTDMSVGPGSNNTILNCDSYGNVGIDGRGEDADGFGAKEQAGKNNVFKGCRSWNNADDGFDFYGWADPISVQDSWSFENAKMMAPGGDGNGFKLGKGAGGHSVTNAISAYNVKTAYTSNGASKLSTCTNCKACSNGSVTGSGDHGIAGSVSNLSPCVDLKKAEGPRKADGSLPSL